MCPCHFHQENAVVFFENHRILVVNIILDINLFIYFLSFTLSFFQKKNFQHILECNRNLFIKSITITDIFEKYSNKNKIDFNRKNL